MLETVDNDVFMTHCFPVSTTVSEATTSQASTTTNSITATVVTTPSTTTSQPPAVSTTATSGGVSSCDNQITNSWSNNIQGKLKVSVPADITDFTIVCTRFHVWVRVLGAAWAKLQSFIMLGVADASSEQCHS